MTLLSDRVRYAAVLGGTRFHILKGSPFVTCSAAESLARQGQLVLLVDLGLNQPTIHNVLRLDNTYGLMSVLSGLARSREVIQRVQMNHKFCVMPAGITQSEDRTAELLSGDRMLRLLENLGVSPFSHVFLHEPPRTQYLTHFATPRPRYGGIGNRSASRLVDA